MDAVQEVKARLNIEDVVGEYVRLKRTGKNYKGLSPFSNEKTPSFVVSPEKQIWHDFSSGRGGDMFTFVQEVEALDFKGSLELLARKAGVDLEKYQTKSGRSSGPSKERLYQVLDAAAKFYQVQLGANKTALNYVVKKRNFNRQTVLDFRIGYSPDNGTALIDYLKKKEFEMTEITAAGLTAQRSGRTADMFRGRIMIPLSDQFGKVVGFTARILYDVEGAPKYINTPATALYDKSRHVYGLHLAKKAIQQQKFSVLVEGNLDVISSHQASVVNVVATAGTAMTEMQLKVLGRFAADVRLAFDEDRAGLAATERAIPIAAKSGVELSVVTIPSGKDPDELIRQDPELWKSVISKHQYAIDWLIQTYKNQLDLTSAVGKRQFTDAVLAVVHGLKDDVEKGHYVHEIAKLLEMDVPSVQAKLATSTGRNIQRLKTTKVEHKSVPTDYTEARKLHDRLLALALMLPGIRGYLEDMRENMFTTEPARKLYMYLKEHPDFDGDMRKMHGLQGMHLSARDDLSPSNGASRTNGTAQGVAQEKIVSSAKNARGAVSSADGQTGEVHALQNYVRIVSLLFEELYARIDSLELQYEAARLRTRLVELFVKDQKKQIREKLGAATEDNAALLLQEARGLDQLLKRTKE